MRPKFKKSAISFFALVVVGFIAIRCGRDAHVVVQKGEPVNQNQPPARIVELPPKIIINQIRPEPYAFFKSELDTEYDTRPVFEKHFTAAQMRECRFAKNAPNTDERPSLFSVRFEETPTAAGVPAGGFAFRFFHFNFESDNQQIVGNGVTQIDQAFEEFRTFGFNQIAASLGGDKVYQNYHSKEVPDFYSTCKIVHMVHHADTSSQQWIAARFRCDMLNSDSEVRGRKMVGEFHCPVVNTFDLAKEDRYYPVAVNLNPKPGYGGKVVSENPKFVCDRNKDGKECTEYFKKGQPLVLKSIPAKGYHSTWDGPVGKDGEKTMEIPSLDSRKLIFASFNPNFVALRAHSVGKGGTIQVAIEGQAPQNCEGMCTIDVPYGKKVVVSAKAKAGYQVVTRDGFVSKPQEITMTKDESITAAYDQFATVTVEIASELTGVKGQKFVSDPPGIMIEGAGKQSYLFPAGTKVTLRAEHSKEYYYRNWSLDRSDEGVMRGYGNFANKELPLGVVKEGHTYAVKATLEKAFHTLTIKVGGGGKYPDHAASGQVDWTIFGDKEGKDIIESGHYSTEEGDTAGIKRAEIKVPNDAWVMIYVFKGMPKVGKTLKTDIDGFTPNEKFQMKKDVTGRVVFWGTSK